MPARPPKRFQRTSREGVRTLRLLKLRSAVASVLLLPALAAARQSAVSASFDMSADTASTWSDGGTTIVQIDGPVTIQTDTAKMTGKAAVIWFSTSPDSVLGRKRAEVALIGDVRLEQGPVVRTGERLYVSAIIAGPIRVTAERRLSRNDSGTDLFRAASALRPAATNSDTWLTAEPYLEAPSSQSTTQPGIVTASPKNHVSFRGIDVDNSQLSKDGFVTIVLRGGVLVIQKKANGDLIELQADSAVLFTTVKDLRELQQGDRGRIEESVSAAYLEGDVRLVYTPADLKTLSEQRLTSDRVYYEFATDRAITTAAVLHTTDPTKTLPITMRAAAVRQLAIGEYEADQVELSTSNFATPSYSIKADKTYIRQHDAGDAYGQRTDFEASSATFRAFGVPMFYLPYVGGELTQRGQPLRQLTLGSTRGFGLGVQSEFGLFETIGQAPPTGLDASYHLDYFGDRGPALGLDAKYEGGHVTDVTRQGWNFKGDFTSYLVKDHGNDRLNRYRSEIPNEDDDGATFGHPNYRGRVQWQHQHFLPDDWQVQWRAGLISDNTFLEEWYENQFDTGLPSNLSAYLKRQRDTEALTFLLEYQPNNFVTTAEGLQERFPGSRDGTATPGFFGDKPFEIDRLPEIGYFRVGDAVSEDKFTFFSENRLSGLRMNETGEGLNEYGFRFRRESVTVPERFAYTGIPSYGYTGTTDDYVGRLDTRQELDFPFDAGQFKAVPYVFGRYTGYSDSPDRGAINRIMAGAGLRVTTAFWNVDDSVENDFFDVHRVRHVIEPEAHLFTSVASVDRDDVYIFDEEVDGISDISAGSFWVRQRWQTKRGGPSRWRSVDFLAVNMGVNVFGGTPDEPTTPDVGAPGYDSTRFGPTDAGNFRGLFFPSMPEASLARTGLNADALWRVSDTTTILGDFQFNLEEQTVATTALGFAAQRGDRLTYYAGLRYIGEADSTIASFNSTYQMTLKYTLILNASFDLNQTNNENYGITVLRHFDRFYASLGAFYDASENEGGFRFSVFPEGLGFGINSDQLTNAGFGR